MAEDEYVDFGEYSEPSDWDADITELEREQKAPPGGAEIYTMTSANGMVTITPAGSKAKYCNKPGVDVVVSWHGHGKSVSVYTSFDDFETPFPLGQSTDPRTGQTMFTGTMNLPPGRYLLRYLVDGEWEIDDCEEVVYSLGNEYNAIVVADPNAPPEEMSESEESDWDAEVEKEQVPDQFKPFTVKGLFDDVDASTGMVTISPAMAAERLAALSNVTKAEREQILHAHEKHNRGSSLQWDAHRGAFVIAKSRHTDNPDNIDELSDENGETGTSGAEMGKGEEGPLFSTKKKKKRNKKKKKVRKVRKPYESLTHDFEAGGHARRPPMIPDIEAIKEEVIKREREWREAWIMHELKTQEIRDKEKAEMRAAWKEEREQWIMKIKSYGNECNELKTRLNEAHALLDKAQSGGSLQASQLQREKTTAVEEAKSLRDQVAKAQTDLTSLRNEVSQLRESNNKLQAELGRAQQQGNKQVDEVRSSAEHAKAQVKSLETQLADMKKDKQALEQKLSTVQKAAADEKAKTLESEVSALRQQLTEAKNAAAAAQSAVASLKVDIEGANKGKESEAKRAAELAARVEALLKDQSKLQTEKNKAMTDLEASLTQLRTQLQQKQASLDKSQSQIEEVKAAAKNSEAAWEREKKTLLEQVERAKRSHDGLQSVVTKVQKGSQAMTETLKTFKSDVSKQVAVMKNGMDETKKFMLQAVAAQSALLSDVVKKYKKELADRRKYFNLVQELRGNIRVFCRARPIIAMDEKHAKQSGSQAVDATTYPDENTIVVKSDKRENEFEFDRVFHGTVANGVIFEDVRDLVTSCMDGYNVCIFAYGQTGSGKTYTMAGVSQDLGVNFRALAELFNVRKQRTGEYIYKISVSMLEIYNEKIRDLLDPKKVGSPQDEKESLKVHKGPNGMYVDGLTEVDVDTEQDVLKCMESGNKNRAVGITNMNEHSSRSHSLLSVKVVGQNLTAGITYYGKLHLIDLAGSERLSKSQAQGQRLKEAQAINKSLSALGNCIEALQKKNPHIPYRDSKLTFLLQDSLGGHAKTLMFINISPTLWDSEETNCSLMFASRVRRVELGQAQQTVEKPTKEKEEKS